MKILIDIIWGLSFVAAVAVFYYYSLSAAIIVLAIPALISMSEEYRNKNRDGFNNRFK